MLYLLKVLSVCLIKRWVEVKKNLAKASFNPFLSWGQEDTQRQEVALLPL